MKPEPEEPLGAELELAGQRVMNAVVQLLMTPGGNGECMGSARLTLVHRLPDGTLETWDITITRRDDEADSPTVQ